MKKLSYLIVLTLILGLVLTGCSLLSNVGQVPATTEQSGITYLTKGGPTEAEAESFPLYAGQDWEVGEVLVWDDGTQVCVKYRLFDGTGEDPEDVVGDGWGLTETHLAVGASLDDIPTNKAGNPKVGNFPFGNDELEGVAEAGPYCIDFGDGEGELDVECDDTLVIAAHAVVSRELGGCNEIGDVYGIARDTGIVWGVDVLTGATAQIFTNVPPPANTNVGPNGLAYDGENRRFYYCNYSSTETLYFWDGEEHVAGSLPGNIAAADFDDGKYYFITGPPYSDDLYEVTFNADGTIAGGNTVKLADIADNEHGWTFNGDIAVKGCIVYGWGLCSRHGYEFFTYDLATPGTPATVIKTDYPASLQLAFGLDGELYGHRSGGTGQFFIINTTNGTISPEVCNTGGILFTDCASGAICIPDIETETAWGAVSERNEPFPGNNWSTYFEYTVECPPCLTPDGELTVTGTGWVNDTSPANAWCPCDYKYDLYAMGTVALKGTVDLSEAAVANTNDWSKYYAKFIIGDSDDNTVAVVFNNDWLGSWWTMDAQPWDRIRMENNMGLTQPLQYYCTVGGVSDRALDGAWVGTGLGVNIYPSDRIYFFQLIADPVAQTFTLQVLGKGSSAPQVGWPKQNMFDYAQWLEIGTIDVGSNFDFTEVSICAELWASTQAGPSETSTIVWEDMEVDAPETW